MTDAAERPLVVILAAGESRRLGRPKALVELGGASALARLARAAGGGLVVTGAHHAQITGEVDRLGLPFEVLHNPDWSRGRTLGLALAAAAHPGRDLLVAPVDVPMVPAEVFGSLRRAWAQAGAPAGGWLAPATTTPTGQARPGHPVLIGRGLAARLPRLAPDAPLRSLREQASPLWTVPVAAEEIHDDLDTPEDLDRLRRRAEA